MATRSAAAAAAAKQEKRRKPFRDGGEDGSDKDSNEGIRFTIDPDVLDCPVCLDSLAPPIFQCYNGHIACSSCCTMVKNCPSCLCLIGLRSLAIEKVIESVKVSCPYAKSGCGEIVSYALRHVHRETCIYSPCHCPANECTFEGPMQELYHHFNSTHSDHATSFQYNRSFEVSLHKDDAFHVLHGDEGVLFLLLNNNKAPIGNAVMVACIGPDSMKGKFSYSLAAQSKESSTQFESSMMNIKHWEGDFPPNDFLLIPQGFCGKGGNLSLQICVKDKKKCVRGRRPRKPKCC